MLENAKAEAAGEPVGGGVIRTWHMEDMSLGQAVWIGACQILSAVFPGTSRSMSTIAGGQLAGMSRASALEFSFFLSIPTMVVATAMTFLKSVVGKHGDGISVSHIDSHGWMVWGLGFWCRLWWLMDRWPGLWGSEEEGILAVCDLPDYFGGGGFVFCSSLIEIQIFSLSFKIGRAEYKTATPKIIR